MVILPNCWRLNMGQFETEKCSPEWGAGVGQGGEEETLTLLWVFPESIPPDSHCEEPKRSLCGFSKEKERVELQRNPRASKVIFIPLPREKDFTRGLSKAEKGRFPDSSPLQPSYLTCRAPKLIRTCEIHRPEDTGPLNIEI